MGAIETLQSPHQPSASDLVAPDCHGANFFDIDASLQNLLRVYLAESYRATAIVTRGGAVPYLDKFGVTPEAQGEGIGPPDLLRVVLGPAGPGQKKLSRHEAPLRIGKLLPDQDIP